MGREPFPTGLQHPGVMGSLWIKEHIVKSSCLYVTVGGNGVSWLGNTTLL